MNSFKKIAIGFGLVSIIALQGLQANELKECKNDADKVSGCVEIYEYKIGSKSETPYENGAIHGVQKQYHENGNLWSGGAYVEDKEHGDHKFYSEDEKLLGTARYNHGKAQFVKCAEKSLSKEDAKHLMEYMTIENFEEYCK